MMRKVLVFLMVVAAALAAPRQFEPIFSDYHEEFGIPQAARIKAIEQALDFDGSRIAGGSPAPLGMYPFMGGLVITLTNGQTSVCGSSLLSHTRMVTAAHCWRHGRTRARMFTVVLGSVYLFSGGLRFNTSQVELHAQYDERTLNNDIAIIRIFYLSMTNPNINRINLPTGSNSYVGIYANAIGFGRTGDNVPIGGEQILNHVRVSVISNAECTSVYGPSTVVESTLCTSGEGGRGACPGDSGGPLQISGNILIGIASFAARAGCTRGFPNGFVRVTSFVAWLQARI